MSAIDFPFGFDARGRTALSEPPDHLRDLLEMLLFTGQGERVNRPSLGTGLMQLVHEPSSPELAAATEVLVQGAIQEWLGNVLAVESVDVTSDEGRFEVRVGYVIRDTGERRVDAFSRSAA